MFISHTTGGPDIGHVTERQANAFVMSTITDLPTHPLTVRFQFYRLFKCNAQVSRGMLCVYFYELEIKVWQRQLAWHGYQWFVRNTIKF